MAKRHHVPIGADIELAEYVADQPSTGGLTSLTDLTDVTGTAGPGLSPVGAATGTDFPLTEIVSRADLDAILASVAATDWKPLPLEPDWGPMGAPWTPARYRLALNSTVFLEGHIQYAQTLSGYSTLISQLPAEIVPNVALTFAMPGAGPSMNYINLYADGRLEWAGYISGGNAEDFVALAGITYSLDAS